jgi:hypothetical protein
MTEPIGIIARLFGYQSTDILKIFLLIKKILPVKRSFVTAGRFEYHLACGGSHPK